MAVFDLSVHFLPFLKKSFTNSEGSSEFACVGSGLPMNWSVYSCLTHWQMNGGGGGPKF